MPPMSRRCLTPSVEATPLTGRASPQTLDTTGMHPTWPAVNHPREPQPSRQSCGLSRPPLMARFRSADAFHRTPTRVSPLRPAGVRGGEGGNPNSRTAGTPSARPTGRHAGCNAPTCRPRPPGNVALDLAASAMKQAAALRFVEEETSPPNTARCRESARARSNSCASFDLPTLPNRPSR